MHPALAIYGLGLWVWGTAAQNWPVSTFVTEQFTPAQLIVNKTGPTAPGYLLISEQGDTRASANPMIVTDNGDLIWQSSLQQADRAYGDASRLYANANIQQLNGRSYLTYYNGTYSNGHSYGAVYILDNTYTQAYRVCLRPNNVVVSTPNFTPDCYADLHESQITSRGTILLTMYNVTTTDLSSVGGPQNGYVIDSQFYEVDVRTNAVTFVWKSLDHLQQLPINLTHAPITTQAGTAGGSPSTAFDYLHINSVELLPDGGYLISSRNLWSLIKLTSTGDVEWNLQGDGTIGTGPTNFAYVGPRLRFSWQHHARLGTVTKTGMTISIHNNANGVPGAQDGPTSGVLMQLFLSNATQRAAGLLKNYTNPAQPIYNYAEGSYQTLPNGNVLIEYGFVPQFTEYVGSSGQVAMTAQFGPIGTSANCYRGYRYPWVGTPAALPKAKFANSTTSAGGSVRRLYMSWNGATEYTQWFIYAGAAQNSLKQVGTANRTGFETNSTAVQLQHGFAQVAAANQQGTVLRKSAIIPF